MSIGTLTACFFTTQVLSTAIHLTIAYASSLSILVLSNFLFNSKD